MVPGLWGELDAGTELFGPGELNDLFFFPEESRIPTPRLALPVGLAFGPAREKVAPEEPPEKRAVLMGPMDLPRHSTPPSFLPRGKVPLRGEEGLVAERA